MDYIHTEGAGVFPGEEDELQLLRLILLASTCLAPAQPRRPDVPVSLAWKVLPASSNVSVSDGLGLCWAWPVLPP